MITKIDWDKFVGISPFLIETALDYVNYAVKLSGPTSLAAQIALETSIISVIPKPHQIHINDLITLFAQHNSLLRGPVKAGILALKECGRIKVDEFGNIEKNQ